LCRKKINDESEVEEEVEKVQEIIGAETVTGFYSYGKWHLLMVIPLANCTIKQ
jgi:hypothetical protein